MKLSLRLPNSSVLLAIVILFLSCNNSARKHYNANKEGLIQSVNGVYSDDVLNIHFKVPPNWESLSAKDLREFDHTTSEYQFLFGIKKGKSLFLLSDYNLNMENGVYDRLVMRMRDTLEKRSLWVKNTPGFTGKIKDTQKKKLGKFTYDVIEYDFYTTANNEIVVKSLLYIRPTSMLNHVVLAFADGNIDEIKEIETCF